jgi:DNA helicase HerA-like ATPase
MMSRADRRRALGKVVSVTADRFVVELSAGSDSFTLVGFDGQHYVARIGSFVLIPLQTEYVVAEVVGLRERELSASEQIESDIEDTHALRAVKFLDVVPVGSLPFREADSFKFGVSVYPPLYSDVLYTQTSDLDRVLEVSDADELVDELDDGESRPTRLKAFNIGTSVVFDDYQVKVRVDEFFGGHCAILGNTGSGKSCTVAAILQSILEKPNEYAARGASFLLFDTNGEYRQAFKELRAPIGRLYALVPGYDGSGTMPEASDRQENTVAFRLPHWFLSPEEWELLLRASDKTQKPILRSALGLTGLFATQNDQFNSVKNHVLASAILATLASPDSLTASVGRIQGLLLSFNTPELDRSTLDPHLALTYGRFANSDTTALPEMLGEFLLDDLSLPDYQNEPFAFETLESALDLAILYEESHGNRHIRDYCSSLLTRFKSIRDRKEYQFLRPDPKTLEPHETDVGTFVELFLGLEKREGGSGFKKKTQLSILDMNQVEDEIVEVVSAVITRLIFERLRRADDRNAFPVNLVLEEAHRYVAERPSDFAIDATKIFERVAKEGRKYGLFIMLASQRPSELSRTVLSQCSNFVVHRIQNPEDLQHVRRMTPFISESVLSRMPSLPKQHALIFGNSVSVPTTFKVREASPKPKSDNARIRHVWFVDDASVTDL